MLTSAKLRSLVLKGTLKLHIIVYLRTKLQVSSIILTSFKHGGVILTSGPTAKRTFKKPNQIRVKRIPNNTVQH